MLFKIKEEKVVNLIIRNFYSQKQIALNSILSLAGIFSVPGSTNAVCGHLQPGLLRIESICLNTTISSGRISLSQYHKCLCDPSGCERT